MRRFDPSNVLAQILMEKSGWLEPLAECKISDVCVSAVITCNVIDSPTLMFFRCLVFRVNYHRRSVFEALWYRCILCDLSGTYINIVAVEHCGSRTFTCGLVIIK